jgi:FtsP/CotA-like multicopper oxidase with cupredoxin domain
MSAAQRLLVVAAAAAVLVVGFVVARAGGDEAPAPSQPAAQRDRESAPVEAAPVEGTSDGHARGHERSGGEREEPTATAEAAPPPPETARIRVRGGTAVGGVEQVRVRRGDRVRLTISADAADEVHLHGYDLERPVGPGQPARLRFTADAEGLFELELHGTHTQIATLEVRPR